MTIDQNQFFRDFTLNICSSLHIEAAMCKALQLLSSYMPAEEMTVTSYNFQNKIFKLVARATKKDGILLDQVMELIPEDIRHIRLLDRTRPVIIPTVANDSILKTILANRPTQNLSCLLIPLTIDDHLISCAQIFTSDQNGFTREHAALISTIIQPFCVAIANALEHTGLIQYKNQLNEENAFLKKQIRNTLDTDVIGSEQGLKSVMDMVRLVAPLSSPVLLIGETGTGKEVIANAIRKQSARSQEPFIKVNCGAIPESLLDSELFGHEKGAFTGALTRKIGRFERAHRGTIFLDEIGELPLEAQIRLLRVIQEREIERVGGTDTIPVDIRIICATNRNLADMVTKGTFRKDLYFRINVFPIELPPLRQRTEDIPLLVDYFSKKKSIEMGLKQVPQITVSDLDALKQYEWPGNVRELQNIIERALIFSKNGFMDFKPISLH